MTTYQKTLDTQDQRHFIDQATTIINHLNNTVKSLREIGKTTISDIQQCFEEIRRLKLEKPEINLIVKRSRAENEKENEKESEKENEKEIPHPVQKKRKVSKNDQVEDNEESQFEEEEEAARYNEIEIREALEEDMKKNADASRDDESIEAETNDEDDTEFYHNAKCGEKDPTISPGARIQVYWKPISAWRRGTVKCWNESAKQYEVEYESDDDEEPLLEHLTGESREKWEYRRDTRDMRRQKLVKAKNNLRLKLFSPLLSSPLLSPLFTSSLFPLLFSSLLLLIIIREAFG